MKCTSILVCGGPGVGKSSLVNLLTKNELDNTVQKLDIESKNYFSEKRVNYKNREYVFYDIVGFDSNDIKWLVHSEAQKNFKKFLSNLNDGFNLVIHVQKQQAISETDQINYNFIIEEVFKKQIKTLCAINFADEEESIELFWKTNGLKLHERGFVYDDGVAVCCGHVNNKTLDMILGDQRNKSYCLLWESIIKLTNNTEKIKASFTSIKDFTDKVLEFLPGILDIFKNVFTSNNVELRCLILGKNFHENEKFMKIFGEGIKELKQNNFCKKYLLPYKNYEIHFSSIGIEDKKAKDFFLDFMKYALSEEKVSVCVFLGDIEDSKEKQIFDLLQNNFKFEFIYSLEHFYSKNELNKETKQEINLKYFESSVKILEKRLERCINEKDLNTIDISLKSKIESVYFNNNWRNKINLDFDFDLYDFVIFSDYFNQTDESLKYIFSNDWKFLSKSIDLNETKHGYSGVAFWKVKNDQFIIVISHRGTRLNFGNILADIEIACARSPDILSESIEYERQILLEMKKFNSDKHNVILMHTGFSLGGYIAASCAIAKNDLNVEKFAITLDAPGVLNHHGYSEYNDKIVNYFLIPNIVNSCNNHVGEKYQIMSRLVVCDEPTIISTASGLTVVLEKEISHTAESHNLDLFKDLTKNYCQIRRVKIWPLADNDIGKFKHSRNNTIIYYN